MVNVPVGVEVMELDSGDTVMAMVSFAPEAGVLVAAESEVVVGSKDEDDPGGVATRFVEHLGRGGICEVRSFSISY
jgi:hypothetical protein